MFDRIAGKYDAATRAISMGMDRGWRRVAVGALEPVEGGRYLDVGTGTGALAFKIARRCPGARVDGIDLSRQMLAVARRKAAHRGGASSVVFCQADATALPMENECYDGIISGFSFRNVERRKQALEEMHRVLKPGGRLVDLEAVYPQRTWVRFGYKMYTPFIPLMGCFFGSFSAFRYLTDSIEDFMRAEQVIEMFYDAGFERVKCRPLMLGAVCVFSAER